MTREGILDTLSQLGGGGEISVGIVVFLHLDKQKEIFDFIDGFVQSPPGRAGTHPRSCAWSTSPKRKKPVAHAALGDANVGAAAPRPGARTLRTTGLPSLISWASIMATLWSMVVEWSVLSAELPTNVPRAKTAAQRTCGRTHARTASRPRPARTCAHAHCPSRKERKWGTRRPVDLA